MHAKADLREKAIQLRRQGKTYSEILKDVSVAKSTLSLWFHEVELAKHQVQRITERRIDGQKKGAATRRSQRIELQNKIWSKAEQEIGSLSDRELWLLGIALYWAEGAKEKEWAPGKRMIFSNSDPRMLRVFLRWTKGFGGVSLSVIRLNVCIHESKRDKIEQVIDFWSKELGLPVTAFSTVHFKRNKIRTKRKNVGLLYNGLVRVSILRSSILMRRIEGWVRGIDNICRVV